MTAVLVPVALGAVVAAYLGGVRLAPRFPRARAATFVAGAVALGAATVGPLDAVAHRSFWVHMVQHLILVFVAVPLLSAGAPVRLARHALPAPAAARVLVLLRSRVVRAATRPIVAWVLFASTIWAIHVTPLYEAALTHDGWHAAEHLLVVLAATVFWLPVNAAEPGASRLSEPARVAYLLGAIPITALLGGVIASADRVLYPTYARAAAAPLADQQAAAAVLWLGGGLALLIAMLASAGSWARRERARDAAVARTRAGAAPSRTRR